AIAADGTIYVGSFDKNLYAIAANGSQKWAFNTLGEIKSSAAIASDGTIYVGSNDNKLYSINPDGTQKWTFETGNFGPVESSPAIGPDGTIYVGSDYGAVSGKSGSLFALNPDGSVKWRFDVEDNVFASPAIGVDGTVYLGSDDDYVYAVNPDGTQKWRYYTGGGYSSPVVGADSTIYVGSKDNRILAINPDGTRKWSFTTSDDIFSSPLVGSDGVIYIGCDDYHIYAITPAGEQKWQYNTGDRITSSPTMAADGTLYCVNYSGKLFALTSGSTAIANSPWPKFRRSMHNDGNAFDQSYPVAKIARNISTAIPGEEFELDGSASIDGDGGSLVYEWAVTEASSGQDKVSFLSPNAARTRVVIRVPGFYKISLKVTDSAGQASYDVIAIEAGIKWTYQTGGSYYYSTTPALGNDGLIYLTSSGENNLYAVKPDGQLAWTFTTNRSATSPAVAEDGTIYLGSNDKNLYAITPQGTQKWAFTTLGEIHSSAAIGPDGTIYVGSNDSRLYAINPDGTQKWSFTTGDYGSVQSSPAIGLDGTIYFGSDYGVGSGKYGSLFALNPNGTLKWRFDADDDITSSPAIGLDGTIYVNSDDDYFYAINPDGTLKWRSFNGGGISSPVIGPDSTIYVGSKNNALYAYTPHGTRKWTYYLKDDVTSTPLVGADGTIFFGCSDQKFYALTPEGKVKWTYDTGDRILCSPTMSTDGTLYFMTRSGKMYAMYSGSQGMANTPWPKFHQNVRNTGQLDALILMDEMKFAFVNVGSPFSKTVQIINASANAIDIQTAEFEHAAFSLQTALPLSIPSNSSSIVTVHILPEKSAFYQSSMELTFTTAGKNKHASSNLEAGLFLEDGSETAVIAHQALDMYEKSKTEDPKSIATENNLGVLYRLLGEPEIASSYLKDALSQSLNKLYGFDGISLNVGVTESDMNKPQAAKQYYAFSLSNNSGTITKKAYYNLALDAYKQDSLEVAASHVQQTLIGATANDFLKAKAYVLRGAIRYRQGDVTAAINDFEQAIRLDPGGPIARMAEENREIITSVEESGEPQTVPSVFVLLPNYPNPFNPETVVSFGLPVNSEVELVIFNVVGQKVVTLLKEQKIAGWHNVTWNGTNKNGVPVSSGIYLLQMKASEFKHVDKMTLLR
ncbi:MAG: PQQ-binding-like beta-propeller repeat protein, partial [bacterium]